VLPDVRTRLVSWAQLLAAPPHLNLPGRRRCQATTRLETVEIARHRERQQSRWLVGRPARGGGLGALQAERREGEVGDNGGDEPDGMLFRTLVVEPLWAQALGVAVCAVDKAHAGPTLRASKEGSQCR